MAIYTCPRCNNKFYLSNKDIKSEDFQRDFRCSSCGATYNDIPADSLEKEQAIQTPSKEYVDTSSAAAPSTVGTAIKGVSIIVLLLCVIGAIVVIGESFAIGLAILIVSVLFGLLSYGIGEIICLLQDIKEKIRGTLL